MKEKKLTAKEAAFVQEYLIDLNQTQAAIRAGYSKKTAGQIGNENLKKPQIAALIQNAMDKRSATTEITAGKVLDLIFRIADVDIAEAFDENGKLLPIKSMPIHVRKAISGVESFEEYEGFGKDRVYVGETKKIKFWDKTKSLEMLGRHLQLFTDKLKLEGEIDLKVKVQPVDIQERIEKMKKVK